MSKSFFIVFLTQVCSQNGLSQRVVINNHRAITLFITALYSVYAVFQLMNMEEEFSLSKHLRENFLGIVYVLVVLMITTFLIIVKAQ